MMKKILKHFRKNWYKYGLDTLVVIMGILIALFLNNWSDTRKQEALEIKFLKRMVSDLASDTAYYSKRISYNKDAIVRLNSYLNESYQTQKNAEDAKNLLKKTASDTDDLNTSNSAYSELTSTGNLSIIGNEKLKQSITAYYRLNNELASNIHEFNGTTTRIMVQAATSTPWLKYLFSLHEDPKKYLDSDWQFLNDPGSEKFQIMESMVTVLRARLNEHLGYFIRLKDSAADLITLINEELGSRD